MENTILITNGNVLSMLSLGGWLRQWGHENLGAIYVTTRLPSASSNLSNVLSLCRKSGSAYAWFKVWMNRFLPLSLKRRGLPWSVASLCQRYQIDVPVTYVSDVNTHEVIDSIRARDPEILMSFSATQRFCDPLIELPSRTSINSHFSLLPRYGGLSPYFWYLNNGEQECGVTLHVIEPRLDAGPIIEQRRFPMEGMTSVCQVALQQSQEVSPMLSRFYSGQTSEKSVTEQELQLRSYFRHPDRKTVADFHARGNRFVGKQDKQRLISMVRDLADDAP